MTYASMAAGMTLAQPNQSFEFPWPPDDKDAPKKLLKKDEVESYLKENMSDDEYSHLQKLIKVQATPLKAQWEAQQQAREKSMADDQKFAEKLKLISAAYNKKKIALKNYSYTPAKT